MTFIASRLIDGKISTLELESEIGSHVAGPVVEDLRSAVPGRTVLIPSHRHLQKGDVILSRKHGRRWSAVECMQRWHKRPRQNCRWTHAMIYIGNLHAVESNKFLSPRSGVESVPLTRDCLDHEFVVLRYRHELTAKRAPNIARHAEERVLYYRRGYDLTAVLQMFLRWRKRSANHKRSISCSELVLECYLIGGGFLADEYTRLEVPAHDNFYFPADLLSQEGFERLEMRYLELELPPP